MRQTSTERPQAVAVSAGIKEWYLTENTDIRETEKGYEYLSKSVTLDHFPTNEDYKQAVWDCIDENTTLRILSGYQWEVKNGVDAGKVVNVWLSLENQNNLKAKHDAARDYPSKVKFPMKYKISEDSAHNAIYEVFQSLEELASFYIGSLNFIDSCINEGWSEKDAARAWFNE